MNRKPLSSPLPEAFLPLETIDQIPELSMVSPEFRSSRCIIFILPASMPVNEYDMVEP